MNNHHPFAPGVAVTLATLAIAACGDLDHSPISPPNEQVAGMSHLTSPGALSAVVTSAGTVHVWPYTGSDFSGGPRDPVNLIFTGNADPRLLRAALVALDGDRTAFGFPDAFPFNCQWTDAVGGVQTAYDEEGGWMGSAIQLECGAFGPLRFHLRLFDAGGHTLGGAHFEVLIPGTTEHQVLSWTLAQQFVTADLLRTGLLGAAPGGSGLLHPVPTFREIPAVVYNGLPAELRAIAGGPAGNVAVPVGIPNSGFATLLHVAGTAEIVPETTRQSFTIAFDQVIPRPFCSSGELDYVHVGGPVNFEQQVVVTSAGVYTSRVLVTGQLSVTPMDVTSLPPMPAGPTLPARVSEHYHSNANGRVSLASVLRQQTIFPPTGPGGGRLQETLAIGPGHSSRYDREESCGS